MTILLTTKTDFNGELVPAGTRVEVKAYEGAQSASGLTGRVLCATDKSDFFCNMNDLCHEDEMAVLQEMAELEGWDD